MNFRENFIKSQSLCSFADTSDSPVRHSRSRQYIRITSKEKKHPVNNSTSQSRQLPVVRYSTNTNAMSHNTSQLIEHSTHKSYPNTATVGHKLVVTGQAPCHNIDVMSRSNSATVFQRSVSYSADRRQALPTNTTNTASKNLGSVQFSFSTKPNSPVFIHSRRSMSYLPLRQNTGLTQKPNTLGHAALTHSFQPPRRNQILPMYNPVSQSILNRQSSSKLRTTHQPTTNQLNSLFNAGKKQSMTTTVATHYNRHLCNVTNNSLNTFNQFNSTRNKVQQRAQITPAIVHTYPYLKIQQPTITYVNQNLAKAKQNCAPIYDQNKPVTFEQLPSMSQINLKRSEVNYRYVVSRSSQLEAIPYIQHKKQQYQDSKSKKRSIQTEIGSPSLLNSTILERLQFSSGPYV